MGPYVPSDWSKTHVLSECKTEKANEEALAVNYTVTKHCGHSQMPVVFCQCNTRFRLLYLLKKW